MRWIHDSTPVPQEELEQDYNRARDLGGVRLGRDRLFFPKFSGTGYLSYDRVAHAWLRKEDALTCLGCRRVFVNQYFLMVEGTDGTVRRGTLDSKALGDEALSRIAAENPGAMIGYHAPASEPL